MKKRKTRSDKGKKRKPYLKYGIIGSSSIALPTYLSKKTWNATRPEAILKKRYRNSVEDFYTRAKSLLSSRLKSLRVKEDEYYEAMEGLFKERAEVLDTLKKMDEKELFNSLNTHIKDGKSVFSVIFDPENRANMTGKKPYRPVSEKSPLDIYMVGKKTLRDKLGEAASREEFISSHSKIKIPPTRILQQIRNTSKLARVAIPALGLGMVGAGSYVHHNLSKR
jgi:hypothetical protein